MTDIPPLRGVQGCVFDAYGTLFDFAAAARNCRDVLGDDIDRLTALWRDKQLQYTWLRAAQGARTAFIPPRASATFILWSAAGNLFPLGREARQRIALAGL